MFNTESLFFIGQSHSVCEDYAYDTKININGEVIPVIAVADGCSSERNTDMGSRFMIYAANKVLREMYETDFTHEELGSAIIKKAEEYAGMMGATPGVNHSTLLLSYPKGDKMCVHMWGDGTFIYNGEPYTIEYSGNAPYYLLYSNYGNFDACYWMNPQDVKRVETNEVVDPKNLYWEFDKESTDQLILLSDGIDSFMYDMGTLPKEELVEELVAFKNRNKGFLARRVQRMLRTFKSKYEIFFHYDDLGIAALIKVEN